ncbi:hypothetical protein D3C71_1196060 [compost metagenome]
MQAAAAISKAGVGSTGPSCTISATPAKPQTQPSHLRVLSVSSFIHAAAITPKGTAMVLSSEL